MAKTPTPKERTPRVNVLLPQEDYDRLTAYCEREGHKKSTLIARIVREYLAAKDVQGRPKARTPSARPRR
jgi:metal-responsive CopG/Arc/MetJ family transcriptional regulator